MLKLKRYLKPYWMLLVCAVVFLFGQAMLELTLPNMMSDIVNVGIQQGGITEVAPKAISADGMALMQAFMSEEDRATAEEQYTRVEDTAPYARAYPNLAAGDYVLKEDADTAAADAAFFTRRLRLCSGDAGPRSPKQFPCTGRKRRRA